MIMDLFRVRAATLEIADDWANLRSLGVSSLLNS